MTQSGHTDAIQAISFSTDGALIVTAGGNDGTARVWDVQTGAELLRLAEHEGTVLSAALSPDGAHVLTVSGTPRARAHEPPRVWDVATGQLALRPDASTRLWYNTAAFSPDGSRILGGRGGDVFLWDAKTGAELLSFEGPGGMVVAAAFSPDGSRVVTADTDSTAFTWDAETGKRLLRFAGHADRLVSAAFSPDGARIVTTSWDNTARVWDAETGEEYLRLVGHGGDGRLTPVYSAAFSPDGSRLVTASSGGPARVWNAHSGRMLFDLGANGEARAVAFSPNGGLIATADGRAGRSTVRIWNAQTGELLSEFGRPGYGVRSAALSLRGDRLVSAFDGLDSPGWRTMWDLDAGTVRLRVQGGGAATLSPDGGRLAAAHRGVVVLFDIQARRFDLELDVCKCLYCGCRVKSITFSPDGGRLLVTVGDLFQDSSAAHVVNARSGTEIVRLDGHQDDIPSAAFSPEGGRVVTASRDGTARVWDAHTGDELARFQGHESGVKWVAFSPDGTRVVSVGRHVWTWNAETGGDPQEIAHFGSSRDRPVTSASFSPDGDRIVTAGFDGTARVWDARTGVELGRFERHAGRVSFAEFSGGGDHVVTAGEDGAVRVWDATSADELVSFYSSSDGSWLVVTPDGRFDAPDLERIDGAAWVAPDDPLTPLPIEAFMREFYEPRLLSRVLADEAFLDVGSILDKNRVQPSVEITAVEAVGDGLAAVTVAAEGLARTYGDSTQTSGVHDLRLFRDGQLVAWADGALVDSTGTWARTFTVPLLSAASGSSNTVLFSVYAFNRDLIKSQTAYADLAIPASAAPPRERRAFVVSLGVNAFDDDRWDLAFAAADARAYQAALGSALAASGDYDDVVSVALVSDHDPAASTKATAAALRGALLTLAGDPLDAAAEAALEQVPGADRLAEVTPDDVVIVTASTHGYTDINGIFYLFPEDIPEVGTLTPTPAHLDAAISSEELSTWLRGVDANEVVLVVDACYAAAAVEGTGFKPGPMGARGLGQLAFDKGMRVLAATQTDAVAIEAGQLQHGLLTFALVENGLLAGQADGSGNGDQDGRLLLDEWLAYGVERVPSLHEEVQAGVVETYGRGLARAVGDTTPLGGPTEQMGSQTPALFDFGRSRKPLLLRELNKE